MHLNWKQKWLLSIFSLDFFFSTYFYQLYKIQYVVYFHRVHKRMSNVPTPVTFNQSSVFSKWCYINQIKRTKIFHFQWQNAHSILPFRKMFVDFFLENCKTTLIPVLFGILLYFFLHSCVARIYLFRKENGFKKVDISQKKLEKFCMIFRSHFRFIHRSFYLYIDKHWSICSGFLSLFSVYCCCYPLCPPSIHCETMPLILQVKITITDSTSSGKKRIILPSNTRTYIYFIYNRNAHIFYRFWLFFACLLLKKKS